MRWRLSPPVLSAGWLCLPPSYRPAVVDGWVSRPLFEPPGDDAVARVLESESGVTLPMDLRALYAVQGGSYAPLLPYGMSLLPYEAMLTCWRYWAASIAQLQGGTPQLVDADTHYDWPAIGSWLPVAENDDSSIVLDFQPGPQGTVGQVLLPLDEVDRVVVALSLTDLLHRWLAALDRGDVRFDPNYGYAVPVDPGADYADVLRSGDEPVP
ncbi:SMI1/KNR4 family protein [Dactylosporangium sp. NPDC048998]|uniref:SMI1/KNR4 family protein n=1 Tax=Dactylosporangium sp. NPDC048998 TaxID=3363976 RepID=UPI00371C417F